MKQNRWFKLSLLEQLANIGAEVGRTTSWRGKDKNYSRQAFYRALDLLALTKADPKNRHRLKEICRVNEMLVDWFLGAKRYCSTDADWERYFYYFNYTCRR